MNTYPHGPDLTEPMTLGESIAFVAIGVLALVLFVVPWLWGMVQIVKALWPF